MTQKDYNHKELFHTVLVSIIVTVKNEENSIASLLGSLVAQEKPFEIVIVDAKSTDNTQEIIRQYSENHPEIKLYIKSGSRGKGRNYGVSKAQGDIIAFTDGGCVADKNWLKFLREKFDENYDVVAGKTVNVGRFKETQRVEVYVEGYDITYPSCNLAYKKTLFEKIGGFDETFVTAEDVDLNLNAVTHGAKIAYAEKAVIYRSSAQTFLGFLKQSFWYGYGRKQLTLKHGKLWQSYSIGQMFQTQLTLQGITRLFFGLLGYLACKIQKGTPKT